MRRSTLPSLAGMLAVLLLAFPAGAEHIEETLRPGEPERQFPPDFEIPVDAQSQGALYSWSDARMGGWGGAFPGAELCAEGHEPRTPVVFVHGTTEDAFVAWRAEDNGVTTTNVRQRFLDGGWCPEELWAMSYTGARGYFTYNDANAGEVYEFIQNVLDYTEADQVDVVAHSLGVTVVRKGIRNHFGPGESIPWLRRFVGIAGANHGTTTCRGLGTIGASHVCEELEPVGPTFESTWLAQLDEIGQTPPGPQYLVIYDSVGDHFYQGPDAHSPRLEGACNHDLPGRFHLPVGRGPESVAIYSLFLANGTLPPCM